MPFLLVYGLSRRDVYFSHHIPYLLFLLSVFLADETGPEWLPPGTLSPHRVLRGREVLVPVNQLGAPGRRAIAARAARPREGRAAESPERAHVLLATLARPAHARTALLVSRLAEPPGARIRMGGPCRGLLPALLMALAAMLGGGGGLAGAASPFSVVAYLPEWRYEGADFEALASVATHLVLFSLEPTRDGGVAALDRLPRPMLMEAARGATRASGCRLLASFGGNGRSEGFSAMARSPEARRRFVAELMRVLEGHSLDGVDYNWEWGPALPQPSSSLSLPLHPFPASASSQVSLPSCPLLFVDPSPLPRSPSPLTPNPSPPQPLSPFSV